MSQTCCRNATAARGRGNLLLTAVSKPRVELKVLARFGDRNYAIVISDVVDTRRPPADAEQRRVCGRVNVNCGTPRWALLQVPGPYR